jgi:CHAT domain-containing protein
VITATLLISVAFPLQLRGNQLVSLNGFAQTSHYVNHLAVTPAKSSKNEAFRLNEAAIKLSQQRRFKEALNTLDAALAININLNDRAGEAATLNNKGRVYEAQGEYSQALRFYHQALLINREIKNRFAIGRTWSNIGNLWLKLNKPELAIIAFKQCVNNREKARLTNPQIPKSEEQPYGHTDLENYQTLGEILLKENRPAEAQRIIDLIKAPELHEFFDGLRGNQNTSQGIELLPEEKQIMQNMTKIFDRAIALGQELTSLRQLPPEKRTAQQTKRIQELVNIQEQILDQFNNFINSPEVETQVEQLSRNEKRQNLNLESLNSIRDNLARMPQKSVLLYPFMLENSLELVLVTPDSPPIHRSVSVKREELNQAILAFREALQDKTSDAKPAARKLYDWLIKPLENDLKQANAKTIIYSPDSRLRYIPLAALYDGKQWLTQRFNINYITAASLTDFSNQPRQQMRILAAAFTRGSFRFNVGKRQFVFSGLPFAGEEVANLATKIPGTKKLLDNDFNPSATVPQLDDYNIVHFATHAAFVVGKPEDSFILFGNGERVTLKDISSWSLPRVDLVVLSACETGLGGQLGNGEEILGFGFQMQKTGAKSAIASLWVVDDGGTEELMNAFYATLPSSKFTKAESLRKAQIALITGNNQRHTHPFYWAPFILIGNGL